MKTFGRKPKELLFSAASFILFLSITLELSLIALMRLLLCAASILLFSSITLYLTGNVDREYTIFCSSDRIRVANQIYTAENLALQYQPIIHQDQKLTSPVPFAVKYEAVSRDHETVIVYHIYWKDEIHPNPFINLLYKFFRILYYGSAVDTEFIEIWIDRTTGNISKIIFETELNANTEVFLPSHTLTKIYLQSNGTYVMEICGKEPEVVNPILSGQHLRVEILTWNHEFRLYEGDNLPSYKPQLSLLTDDEYKTEKYARRSAYTYTTRERFLIPIIILEISIIILCFLFINQILSGFRAFLSLLLHR